jgi:predicted TIM-barrel fold metal-dependent hydrolase
MPRPLDAHVHVGHWKLPDFGGHGSTVEELVALYQRYDWGGALVFPTDEADNRWLLEAVPLTAGSLALRRAFWVDPRSPSELEFLRAHAGGFAALKIHPSILRLPINDELYAPWLEAAADLDLPVIVHCGKWLEMAGYGTTLECAELYPKVRFILGHMGGDLPHLVKSCVREIQRLDLANCFLGTESIREPWLLQFALGELGPQRLVFGSDYNLNHPEVFRRLIEVLDLDDSSRELILGENLNRLLPEGKRFY